MTAKCSICGKFVSIKECEITYVNAITINTEMDYLYTQIICKKCKKPYIIVIENNIEELEEK